MAFTKEQQNEAIEVLQKRLKPGDTVYTTVTHVSRSGMLRTIRAFVMEGNEPSDISFWVARALRWPFDDRGVKVTGAGMDMGFHLIYSLSYALFPDGFTCIGEQKGKHWTKNCPANDHSNGDRNYKPHKHNDGGYALRQKWL